MKEYYVRFVLSWPIGVVAAVCIITGLLLGKIAAIICPEKNRLRIEFDTHAKD